MSALSSLVVDASSRADYLIQVMAAAASCKAAVKAAREAVQWAETGWSMMSRSDKASLWLRFHRNNQIIHIDQ